MRGQAPPTTPWEIEAARHQEVVASDFGSDRPGRSNGHATNGVRAGILARLGGLLSAEQRTASVAPTERADPKSPCPPGAVRAMKPGA
jgi:hypothetical protein